MAPSLSTGWYIHAKEDHVLWSKLTWILFFTEIYHDKWLDKPGDTPILELQTNVEQV